MRVYLLVVLTFLWFSAIQAHPKLSIDEFFNVTTFRSVSLSPNGRYLLVHSQRPAWDFDCYEYSLWLYETSGHRKQLISKELSEITLTKWSPSGDYFVYKVNQKVTKNANAHADGSGRSSSSVPEYSQQLHFYSVKSNEVVAIEIGQQPVSALTWSDDESCLYFAAQSSSSADDDAEKAYEAEWKDVIVYRRRKPNDGSTIHRIDISKKRGKVVFAISPITKLDFTIGELLYVPFGHQLAVTSVTSIVEDMSDLEMYSIDLNKPSSITKLTDNHGIESKLQLSIDGKHVFYQLRAPIKGEGNLSLTQDRLYSVDIASGKNELWGKGFKGSVVDYSVRSEGGVFILGLLGTSINVYVQQSSSKYLILQPGWNGSYLRISSSSSEKHSSIAFLHSSFNQPVEVYFASHVDELCSPKMITHANQFLTKRNIPQAKVYQWINTEDHRMIEGILHYPPGKFGHKNLPLFVLIHGGPNDASLNYLLPDWYNWGPLAASEGWLVLQPNYRGSIGYGDQSMSEIVGELLSLPGKDILAGVDSLVNDGIADPSRLNIGGYSYGGYLTNWLITQTTRFNAALSGAGPTEHVSMWGTADFPVLVPTLLGGYPWEVPETYNKESIVYNLDKVTTPTLIVSGAKDTRVPVDQSFILERSLNYLEIPVSLLLFPNENHDMEQNPWHGKIKVREELKWLEKYGHICAVKKTN